MADDNNLPTNKPRHYRKPSKDGKRVGAIVKLSPKEKALIQYGASQSNVTFSEYLAESAITRTKRLITRGFIPTPP